MNSVNFIFTKETKVYFLFSYRFIDYKGKLIPLDELEKFRYKITKDTPKLINNIRFDNKKAYYSFFDSFCTEENMPLVISIDLNELPTEEDTHTINGEISKKYMPSEIQIRLSQYGVATVRILFNLHSNRPRTFDKEFLDLILRILKLQAKEYVGNIWRNFCEIWNKNSEYKISKSKEIDIYLILLLSGIKVKYDNKEIILTELKKDDINISQITRKNIEKILVGLALSSYLWPKYSEDFIQKFLRSDLSTTKNEFQFVAWRNALIYFEGEEAELPTPYYYYLEDMILGLELLFQIRSSLQLLDFIIDKEISQKLVHSTINPLQLIKVRSNYKILEYFDRWLLLIAGWKRINRYAVISHFHDFLKFALDAMRIDVWLYTVRDKIDLLKETTRTQSNMIVTINLVLLTLILVGLTFFLILK